MKKNWIKLLISLIIGGLFIWLVIKDAPVEEVFSANNQYTWENTTLIVLGPPDSGSHIVWQFDLLYIIPYFLVLTIIHLIRTLRWRDLLKPLGEIDFWRVNNISSVGFMAIMLFPLRLGEFVRPYLVKTQCNIRMSAGRK